MAAIPSPVISLAKISLPCLPRCDFVWPWSEFSGSPTSLIVKTTQCKRNDNISLLAESRQHWFVTEKMNFWQNYGKRIGHFTLPGSCKEKHFKKFKRLPVSVSYDCLFASWKKAIFLTVSTWLGNILHKSMSPRCFLFVCLFVCIFEPRFVVFRLCFFKNKNPNIEIQARVTIKTGRISLLLRYEASKFTDIFYSSRIRETKGFFALAPKIVVFLLWRVFYDEFVPKNC